MYADTVYLSHINETQLTPTKRKRSAWIFLRTEIFDEKLPTPPFIPKRLNFGAIKKKRKKTNSKKAENIFIANIAVSKQINLIIILNLIKKPF